MYLDGCFRNYELEYTLVPMATPPCKRTGCSWVEAASFPFRPFKSLSISLAGNSFMPFTHSLAHTYVCSTLILVHACALCAHMEQLAGWLANYGAERNKYKLNGFWGEIASSSSSQQKSKVFFFSFSIFHRKYLFFLFRKLQQGSKNLIMT